MSFSYISGGMFSRHRGGEVYRDHFQSGLYVCVKFGHKLFSRSVGRSNWRIIKAKMSCSCDFNLSIGFYI